MSRREFRKPSKKEILIVVRQWMERERKVFKTKLSGSSDHNIDCPQCGDFRGISFYPHQGWMCRRVDCSFVFSEELRPPTPQEFEDYLKREKFEKRIKMFLKSK